MPTTASKEASLASLKPRRTNKPRRLTKTSTTRKKTTAAPKLTAINWPEFDNEETAGINKTFITPAAKVSGTAAPLNIPAPETVYWRWLAWFGISVLVILLAGALIVLLNYPGLNSETATVSYQANKKTVPPAATTEAALTGQLVTAEAAARRPWAVIIENFPTVRPQAGLAAADLVIESPTEGGITRFLTIYQSDLPTGLVGPVRSARSFFNDWARPLTPFYSHSGGSEKALKQLQKGYGGIQDVNEFFNAAAYQRDDSKTPPHNLFTTAARFWNYVAGQKWNLTAILPKLTFKDTLPASKPAQNITIPYQPSEYQVVYNYKSSNNTYARATGGTTQFDSSTSTPPAIKNVIILFTDITPIPNDILKRVDMKTTGSGKLMLFAGGQMYEGKWTKTDSDSFFKFQDKDSKDLALTPGKTWISVIDKSQYSSIQISGASLTP